MGTKHRISLLAVLACVLQIGTLVECAWATIEGWSLFRDELYSFRFEYPGDWVSKEPRGKHVRALVSDPATGTNCNVLVRSLPGTESISPEEALALMTPEEMLEGQQQKMPDARLVSSKRVALDNRPALMVEMEMSYETVLGKAPYRQLLIWSFSEGRIYQLICGGSPEVFDVQEPILLRIASTFVFETWEEGGAHGDETEERTSIPGFQSFTSSKDGFRVLFPAEPQIFQAELPDGSTVHSYQAIMEATITQYSVFVNRLAAKMFSPENVTAFLETFAQTSIAPGGPKFIYPAPSIENPGPSPRANDSGKKFFI